MSCWKWSAFLVLVSLWTLPSGCSDSRPKRVAVSGQVLIDGAPLQYGFVQVVPENDRPASGKIGPDGRFTLTTFEPEDGCVLGTHKVAVIANESIDPQSQKWHAPKSYIDVLNSGLSVEVVEPTDQLVIELTWGDGEPFVERFDSE